MFSLGRSVFLIAATLLVQVSSRRHHHHHRRSRDGEVAMNDFVAPGELAANVPSETAPQWHGGLRSIDFGINAGLSCRCSVWKDWTTWSPCTARREGCYKATQVRVRRCQRDCTRIQIRNCLDVSTCTGTWGPWMVNSNCSDCVANGFRKSVRLCKSSSGDIGPYCIGSKGQVYQDREESCNKSCPEVVDVGAVSEQPLTTPQSNGGGKRLVSPSPRTTGWIETSKGNLVVILLSVIAGVMLVALIFVSVMFTSLKRRKFGRRGINRDLRSASESNISATSYLSALERDSRVSGRASIYQQHRQSSARRSLMLPHNLSSLSMSAKGSSSIQVRCPMQHTDSLMLARKQMNYKRANKGSLRSINKLLRERNQCDRRSVEGDGFLVEGLTLRGEENESSNEKQDKSIKRRATDGAYDTYERQKQRGYLAEENINTKAEEENKDHKKEKSSQEREKEPDSDSSSMDSGYEKTKKRLSVDDIRRLFENRSAEQSPSRSSPKGAMDIPLGNTVVGENISRFEQASAKNNEGQDRAKRFFGSLKRKKKSMVISSKVIQSSTRRSKEEEKKSGQQKSEPENSKENVEDTERPDLQDIQSTLQNSHSHTTRPRKATFLFSHQAYNSLQRSNETKTGPESPNKGGFKLDIDAFIKKTIPTPQGANNDLPIQQQKNESKGHLRGPHDSSPNGIIVPPHHAAFNSYDSDTYADVWDAKVKETDAKSTDSVYADVWDSNSAPRSICEDDEGDYSEVYDAADNSVNVAKARRFAKENHASLRKRSVSQGTTPPRSRGNAQRMIFDDKQTPAEGSSSCGASPARPPLPLYPIQRQLSRKSSTGSDGSAPQDRLAGAFILPPTNAHKSSSELQTDALYCVI